MPKPLFRRGRRYLHSAHMRHHLGENQFFVERYQGGYYLGMERSDGHTAIPISKATYKALVKQADVNDKMTANCCKGHVHRQEFRLSGAVT